MTKKQGLLIFICLSIIGSVVCFYLGSFLFLDIGNYSYGWNGLNFFSTIPGLMICFELIAISILFIRYFINPVNKYCLLKLYSKILIGIACVGIIGTILAAIFAYGTLFSKYPFPFYLVLCLLIHSCLIIYLFFNYKKINFDLSSTKSFLNKKRITFGYVIFSACLSGYMFFAYYKFGAFLLSPLYIQWSTFHMTWSTYLWLTTPILLIYYYVLKEFNILENINDQILFLSLYFILNTSFIISHFVTSSHNSLFISAVSPAFGLDRLATNPYVAIFHSVVTTLISLVYLTISIYKKIKNK